MVKKCIKDRSVLFLNDNNNKFLNNTQNYPQNKIFTGAVIHITYGILTTESFPKYINFLQ